MPIQESVFKKEDICAAFNISLATVNNWIKTELIPAPSEGGYLKKKYTKIIEKIKCDSGKLKMRANRSFLHESDTVFLGIKDKARKSLPMEILEKELDELMDKLANVEDFRAEIDRIQ